MRRRKGREEEDGICIPPYQQQWPPSRVLHSEMHHATRHIYFSIINPKTEKRSQIVFVVVFSETCCLCHPSLPHPLLTPDIIPPGSFENGRTRCYRLYHRAPRSLHNYWYPVMPNTCIYLYYDVWHNNHYQIAFIFFLLFVDVVFYLFFWTVVCVNVLNSESTFTHNYQHSVCFL